MNSRSYLGILALMAGLASGAGQAATFSVDSAEDAVDVAPGDGVCLSLGGTCTLRAAVMEANVFAGADTVDLTAMNDPLVPVTLTLVGVDETFALTPQASAACSAAITADASIGDLDITEDLTIQGAGPASTIVRWDARGLALPAVGDRVFHVQAAEGETIARVRFADLTIANGGVGVPESLDPDGPYNCAVTGATGTRQAWQFRRFGGAIAVGHGAAVVQFDEALHASGAREPARIPAAGVAEGDVGVVELERVAVIDNRSGSDGGGLDATSPMTVVDSVFSANEATGNGGALYLEAASTVTGTLIGDSSTAVPYASGAVSADRLGPNRADDGGGLFAAGSHTSLIERSALNLNEAVRGGAIASRPLVRLNIANTTISGNDTSDVGAGISSNGTIRLRSVTLANNRSTLDATGGGAGLNGFGSGTFLFANTLFSGNVVQAPDDAEPREANCGCTGTSVECPQGVMVTEGHNLNDQEVETCGLRTTANDQLAADPLLGPLTNNGGRTETHRIPSTAAGDAATSAAIDAGSNALCPNNDQRGSLRPEDGDADAGAEFDCDIGAVELFVPRSDLNIVNVTAPDLIARGETFAVVVVIRNDDDVLVPAVTYDATVTPATGLAIVGAASTAGSCTVLAGDDVSCAIGDLAADAMATVTLTLTAGAQDNFTLQSQVANDPGYVDPVPENNAVTSRIAVIGTSDLELSVDVDRTGIRVDERVTFDFMISNNGADDASNVRLGLPVPSSVSFFSASYTPTYSCYWGGGLFLCQVGELAAGETATFRLIVEGETTGQAVFSANVLADQPDPDLSNNAVQTTVTIDARAKSGGGGGGGCAYQPGAALDPVMPGLLAFALLALFWRRRRAH